MKGSRKLSVDETHLKTIDRYSLFSDLLDSNGIVEEGVLEKLRLNVRSLLGGEPDPELLDLTCRALRIYSVSFLLMGFNGYASAFFTALNNGVVSAVISVNRTLVCETLAVLLIPLLFGVDGIWYAIIFAESAALILTTYMLLKYRKRYGYAGNPL